MHCTLPYIWICRWFFKWEMFQNLVITWCFRWWPGWLTRKKCSTGLLTDSSGSGGMFRTRTYNKNTLMTQNQKNNQRTINLDKIILLRLLLYAAFFFLEKGSKLSSCISCSHKGALYQQFARKICSRICFRILK